VKFLESGGITNLVGSALTDVDYDSLSQRWITREIADAAGLRRVDSVLGAEQVGRKNNRTYSGILIPNVFPGTNFARDFRLRRDRPDLEIAPDGTKKERQKYLSARGAPGRLYFPPNVDPDLLADVSIPIVLTEGEF
jgi:hypothetical protein